ncbi:MAG: hypothetical protein VX527_11395 [Planctomycetota bacterium]|nr:hypothetical protein [Planctomycetota bacterium]
MEDRLPQAASGVGGGGSEPQPRVTSQRSDGDTDVLGILEDIESQFDRLRTIRSDQVEALRELAERSTRLEEKKVELGKLQDELDKRRKEWDRTRQHEQDTIDETQRCLEADRASHTRRIEEDKATLARDRDTFEDDRERTRRETDAQRHKLGATRDELDTLQELLESRSKALEEAQAELDENQKRLQNETLEQEVRHEQMLDALRVARREIGRRGRRLRNLEEVIQDLRQDRRQLRARRRGLESAGRSHRHHITALVEQVQAQDARLDEAGRRLRTFMEQLREQTDLVERGNAALALVDQLEGRIEELEEALATNSDTEETRGEVAALKEELDRLQTVHSEQEDDLEAAVKDRTRRLADVAKHLHIRRTRLRSLRKALRRGSTTSDSASSQDIVSQRLRQSEIIEQRQRELDDVRRMLASSEKKMIKRWAGPRSLVLTSWGLVLVVIIAAASWLSAERVRPALRTASVVLAPKVDPGRTLDDTETDLWQDYHATQLKSDGFIRDVARRSAGRRLVPWDSHEAVRRLLETNLVMDTGEPGRLILTLAANDPERAAAFLDILATSMAVGSQRSMASRPGGHASTILDTHSDDGVLRYARVAPSPLRDDRLVTASLFFGGGLLLTFMAMGLVYARLLKAKRIFEQAHPDDLEVNTMSVRPI